MEKGAERSDYNTVFWDVMSHSLVDCHQCFAGTCCLHLPTW